MFTYFILNYKTVESKTDSKFKIFINTFQTHLCIRTLDISARIRFIIMYILIRTHFLILLQYAYAFYNKFAFFARFRPAIIRIILPSSRACWSPVNEIVFFFFMTVAGGTTTRFVDF